MLYRWVHIPKRLETIDLILFIYRKYRVFVHLQYLTVTPRTVKYTSTGWQHMTIKAKKKRKHFVCVFLQFLQVYQHLFHLNRPSFQNDHYISYFSERKRVTENLVMTTTYEIIKRWTSVSQTYYFSQALNVLCHLSWILMYSLKQRQCDSVIWCLLAREQTFISVGVNFQHHFTYYCIFLLLTVFTVLSLRGLTVCMAQGLNV